MRVNNGRIEGTRGQRRKDLDGTRISIDIFSSRYKGSLSELFGKQPQRTPSFLSSSAISRRSFPFWQPGRKLRSILLAKRCRPYLPSPNLASPQGVPSMQSRIVGTTMPVLEFQLDHNDCIISEAGELSWMSPSVQMTTHRSHQPSSSGAAGQSPAARGLG